MRYVLVDIKGDDVFSKDFGSLEEAIKQGEIDFSYLTASDKKKRSGFYVLESVNPDEDAEDHMDGSIVKQWI